VKGIAFDYQFGKFKTLNLSLVGNTVSQGKHSNKNISNIFSPSNLMSEFLFLEYWQNPNLR